MGFRVNWYAVVGRLSHAWSMVFCLFLFEVCYFSAVCVASVGCALLSVVGHVVGVCDAGIFLFPGRRIRLQ